MSYREEIEARLERNKQLLSKAQDALQDALDVKVKSYGLDTGEGSQRTVMRRLDDIQDLIDRLNANIRSDMELLYGMGVININLRRKKSVGMG